MNSLIVVFAILAITYPLLDAYSIKSQTKSSVNYVETQFEDSDDQTLIDHNDQSMEHSVDKNNKKKGCKLGCFKIKFACICPHHDQVEESDDQTLIDHYDQSMENSVDKKKKKGCKSGCFHIGMACVCPHHFDVTEAEVSVDDQLTCKIGCVHVGPLCLCIHNTKASEVEDLYFDVSLAKKSTSIDIFTGTKYSCKFGCIKKDAVCICPKRD